MEKRHDFGFLRTCIGWGQTVVRRSAQFTLFWTAAVGTATAVAQVPIPVVNIDWKSVVATTRTTITLQVVENPPLRPGSPIHDAAWQNLAALHSDMTRLALWYPYPRLAVAELLPPLAATSSWDFKAIDPIVEDFFRATDGHSSVFTVSTIPTWMFLDADPGPIPASPDTAVWNYEAGTELRDPSGQQLADYFARVAGWYATGGFTDEAGQRHVSTHHHNIAWWEVLNEPEYEHEIGIETYTRLYDRIVSAVHAVSPTTRFVGMSLAEPMRSPEKFEYFLNPANHRAGTPLDAISYHFYADSESGETDAAQQYTFFARADAFLNSVRYIENIRKRLSPGTQTHINEAGCIAADDLAQGADRTGELPSAQYWNLCGAMFAYLYAGLAEQGIDVLGASQLLGYPTQFPSVTLLDWRSGLPNARYRVLQLLHENFGPGDLMVKTVLPSHNAYAAAFLVRDGSKKALLINKRAHPIDVRLPGADGAVEQHADVITGPNVIASRRLQSDVIHLEGFSVMVVSQLSRSMR
jgi:hypothetical protein